MWKVDVWKVDVDNDTVYNVNLQLSMCCCFSVSEFYFICIFPDILQSHSATINAVRRN